MGFTTAELDEFHRFAHAELRRGAASNSLEECLRQWRIAEEDRNAAIADIREGMADEEAGRVRPLAEVVDDIREKLGINS